MEAAPSPSQKSTKFETTHQLINHRSSSARGGASNNAKHHHQVPPAAGQVAFRLLCHVHTAAGVIGNSGCVVKHLETLTGSKIRFEEVLPNCHERVILIVGDAAVENRISVGGGREDDEMVDVSKAQEGLLRVFERVLEVEGNDDDEDHSNVLVGCRLLAQAGRIRIRTSSGAKIRVLQKEQVPPCADPEEELLQITGGIMAVKKALLAVSHLLQDRTLAEGANGHLSSIGVLHDLHASFSPKNSPLQHHSVGHSMSANVKKTLNLHEDISLRKVMFRILCSNGIAGGVIGKGENIIRSLENETGASVKFTSPVSGSMERVAIISALESRDPLYSPAQIAVVRVFARCVEVCLDQGLILSLGKHENVSARILVGSSQIGCLMDDGGRVSSDISIASGTDIRLVGANCLPKCSEIDDNVVQINGNYENVKSALFQLTGRLRENIFSRNSHTMLVP